MLADTYRVESLEDHWRGFWRFSGTIAVLFYFTIFVPFAVGARLFSDPLQHPQAGSRLGRSRTGRQLTG